MIQVAAEFTLAHHGLKVTVAGGENLDVHADFAFRAQPAEFPVLDGLEQLGLQVQRHFADFVEEQGAAIRLLDQAAMAAGGAGEGAGLVAEELRFQQVVGKGGAVEFDQRGGAAFASMMQDAGREALAGAGFAANDDGAERYAGQARQHVTDFPCGRAGADEGVGRVAAMADLGLLQ